MDPDYPKPCNKWQGVPDDIKAAFMSRDQSKNPFFNSVPQLFKKKYILF